MAEHRQYSLYSGVIVFPTIFWARPLMTSSSIHDAQRADDQGKEAWRHSWECAVWTYIENYISRQSTIYMMAKVVTSPLTLHFYNGFPLPPSSPFFACIWKFLCSHFFKSVLSSENIFLISSFPLVLFHLSRFLSQYSIYQALQKAGARTLDWYTQRYLSRKDLKCWISQGQSLQNQMAAALDPGSYCSIFRWGKRWMKGWEALRADPAE